MRDDELQTNNQSRITGGEDEHFMDRQYQYISVGDSNHHGFLSHDAVERINPLAKKGIKL